MTSIEWVRNPGNQTQGISVNSKTGCLNHENGLCKGGGFPCYAYKLAHGRLKHVYQANHNIADSNIPAGDYPRFDPFYPRFWPERLEQIRAVKKPTGIFLDDMSDWMGEYWPREWTCLELQVMSDNPQHRFYTLTKQPQNLIKWSPFPENVYVGVTATNDKALQYGLVYLANVEAKIKYISFEPLLEKVSFLAPEIIDWLIIGACTGTKNEIMELHKQYPELTPVQWKGALWTLQPRIQDLREIVEAADRASVKVFLKDNLRPLLVPEDCRKPNYLTEDIFWASEKAKLRQELPMEDIVP